MKIKSVITIRRMLCEKFSLNGMSGILTTLHNIMSNLMNSSKKFNLVPQFKTLQEEADFWDTHDSMEYELEDTEEMVELSNNQKSQIRERWEKCKRAM